MKVKKRNGLLEDLDIKNIQKCTIPACEDLDNVNSSELEVDAHIKFINGMSTVEIQDALIKTAVEKIDIDRPHWTFVAARLFLYDLYHSVGKVLKTEKGQAYGNLEVYVKNAIACNRMSPDFVSKYDLEDLNSYIVPERDMLFNYLGIKTLYDRYLLKDNKKNPIELPQYMFMAIAMFLAQNESDPQARAKEFYDVVSKFEVMLATPTLSNARTHRHQLSSCYIGSSPDNIEGIFDSYKEMGLLSKFGGGIGWDWNKIRSMGGDIDGHANAAGGTVPFLKINNDIAIAVDQLGTRKGAIAVYLEPWHMDIEDFVDLKKNSGEERRRAHDLFPALWISDIFMERVISDGVWTLFDPNDVKDLSETYGAVFKQKYVAYENDDSVKKVTIRAKELWKKILTSYYESGSPFLCFKDTANVANPNKHTGHIRSSNLCTEIFQNTSSNHYQIKVWINDGKDFVTFEEEDNVLLATGTIKHAKKVSSLDTIVLEGLGQFKVFNIEKHKVDGKTAVCNLASINLSRVKTREDIERVTPIAVRMLDNVIELNFYPLNKVKHTNLESRSIGLGVMGEAEMLAVDGIVWGSKEHFNRINELMEAVSYNTIYSSSDLALEKGTYPAFEGSEWSHGIMPHDYTRTEVLELTEQNETGYYNWDALRSKVKNDGMRNGYLMAIAPTSSISILVGTTQAIEPVYKRKWYEENLSGLIPVVVPQLDAETWSFYTPAYEVDQLQLIRAAAVRQKWIDQGQSTNIFMALDKASGKYLNDIYVLAWKLGLKSTYYLRSQSPEAESEKDVADRSIECSGCQ